MFNKGGYIYTKVAFQCEKLDIIKARIQLGCARFAEFLQNFSELQILWSLCSVVFHALTLESPIQTSLSVAPELQVSAQDR